MSRKQPQPKPVGMKCPPPPPAPPKKNRPELVAAIKLLGKYYMELKDEPNAQTD
jgi:hypothetical protein